MTAKRKHSRDDLKTVANGRWLFSHVTEEFARRFLDSVGEADPDAPGWVQFFAYLLEMNQMRIALSNRQSVASHALVALVFEDAAFRERLRLLLKGSRKNGVPSWISDSVKSTAAMLEKMAKSEGKPTPTARQLFPQVANEVSLFGYRVTEEQVRNILYPVKRRQAR